MTIATTPDFEYRTPVQRVLFRTGGAMEGLAEAVRMTGARRVLVIAAEAEADLAVRLTERLPVAGVFDRVRPHVPVEIAEEARDVAAGVRADLVVSVGGGSTTGTAKAVALTTGLPVVAVPTTYAGSEATDVWGLTEGQRKTTGADPRVMPRIVVYDATLQLTLPRDLTVVSGLNALAHCVDSLWSVRANPVSTALAMEGASALHDGLRAVHTTPDSRAGRQQCLYGAFLAASAFASAGSGLHHKICHVLGGAFDLPHAQTHAIVLPHVAALNVPATPGAQERLSSAMRAEEAVEGLVALASALGAPTALRDIGLREEDLAEAATLVLEAVSPSNPRTIGRTAVESLLRGAWAGNTPVLPTTDPSHVEEPV